METGLPANREAALTGVFTERTSLAETQLATGGGLELRTQNLAEPPVNLGQEHGHSFWRKTLSPGAEASLLFIKNENW